MALSLVLRSAIKVPGRLPSVTACGVIPFNVTTSANFSHVCFKTPLDPTKKNALSTTMITCNTKPGVRYFGSKSDFRLMWTIERGFSLALVGLIPATIACPCPILDNACAVIVGLHLHWGMEAVCEDYVRPIVVGNFVTNMASVATYALSILVITGLLYFNYNDVGIGKGIRKLWAIKE